MSDLALLLAVALLLDALIGEPRALWTRLPHPVVWMGRAVTWLDDSLNQGKARKLKGTIAVAVLATVAIVTGIGLTYLPFSSALEVAAATVLLAQKSLADHVRAVAEGLDRSLEDGRTAVSMIVGRTTTEMDTQSVSRAAIESAAENLSDGVVAPAFWFLIAGAPGIILYKIVNTADSIIGHKTKRYQEFGWAAARLDDVLNWVPARLTAVLIAGTAAKPSALVAAFKEGPHHRSVNAGWPEAAMAHVLGIRLSGPRLYDGMMSDEPFVNPEGRRDVGAADIRTSVIVLWRVWATLVLGACALALL